ncbi:unnamed protein product [Pocillopora meandrina]|uniref:Uncharacterized protein n=1 Tax=Pocillopora meandrina TaxID=46732 RepID=A0AAU9WH24_9CNID|nr:unnamed protein product [Pocillopora meandrina]
MIFMVASFVGTVSHTVSITTKGNVVFADKEQCLIDFLSKFGRNPIETTNLSTLANTGVNRDVSGKKGQTNKTRRQAGRIERNISKCASRGLSFPKTNRPIPYDIVLRHPERYEYPDKDNPGQTKSHTENGMRIIMWIPSVSSSATLISTPHFSVLTTKSRAS